MKKIIYLIAVFVILILTSASVQAQDKLLLLFGDDDSLVKETKDYITRVKNDEGAVVDKKFINTLIKIAKKDR